MKRYPERRLALIILSILLTPLFYMLINSSYTYKSYSEETGGCATQQCHPQMQKGRSLHPVLSSCESCHEAVDKKHPQKGKETFKLSQQPPALCFMCHGVFGTAKGASIHQPVKDGMCTFCHNPHRSENQKLLNQPMGDLCFNCHQNNISGNYVHGPAGVGSCTICHNPHESQNPKLTVNAGEALCFTCHSDMQEALKAGHIHPAVMMGCTSCHNPHSGPFKKMLSADGKDLCFQCHPGVSDTLKTAKSIHSPIKGGRSCISCHSPHAGKTEILTEKSGKDFCTQCHTEVIGKSDKYIHGPIKDGSCTACHLPHGTQNKPLLKKRYPEDFYTSYSESEYELCFGCHNKEFLMFPDTSFATGFRDGNRNLHFIHVNREKKSRTCRFCHNVHSAKNPRLMRDYINFGQWRLPLNFEKTETGGSCTPGCHKQFIYDRKTPGKEAEKAPKELPR